MAMLSNYSEQAPSRAEVDAYQGATVIEFGTDWCGHCQAAQPHLAKAFSEHLHLQHLKIEDGPGRPLGRSFRVKLWPTLIFMRDGEEIERLVRPQDAESIRQAMNNIVR
ncbi:thioredoxin family protein [Halopseudomonas sp. SMJS2]|uniref:thioredoxin family protein n=1 Tax=Halopseudomonas sp. SMJS2 TaxID=3041098 RepID=UPI000445CCB8|nr:thioredoxin family protein [Halopseudomonas sp. SMJS2]EZQ20048.1 thioredoxin [Halopseudomonas bauzanensis]WGK60177.1 thioredoxin family protein [Halopseudomonas sp. SMJS2]